MAYNVWQFLSSTDTFQSETMTTQAESRTRDSAVQTWTFTSHYVETGLGKVGQTYAAVID